MKDCPDCGATIVILSDGTWCCDECSLEEVDFEGDPHFVDYYGIEEE